MLTSLSTVAYSQILSIETALVSISHALRTQTFRIWITWGNTYKNRNKNGQNMLAHHMNQRLENPWSQCSSEHFLSAFKLPNGCCNLHWCKSSRYWKLLQDHQQVCSVCMKCWKEKNIWLMLCVQLLHYSLEQGSNAEQWIFNGGTYFGLAKFVIFKHWGCLCRQNHHTMASVRRDP